MRRFTGRLFRIALATVASTFCAGALAQGVFINEIHYDNAGTDSGERIEIAGPAGTDVSGWRVVRYNGSAPAAAVVYATPAATETLPSGTIIPNAGSGFGFILISYPQDGLQNGPSDGVALVDAANNVIQFLSYEGVITASNGLAAGLTSQDIGVSETTNTVAGHSLQLSGTGSAYGDFIWTAAQPNTFGAANAGQTFLGTDTSFGACGDAPTFIHDVQGPGSTSPRNGQVVVIEGIVVGDFQGTIRSGIADPQLSGFFVQEDDNEWDANPATSEGIFVFQGNATVPVPDVQIGERVRVRGTVLEFDSSGIALTELTSVSGISSCGTGNGFTAVPVTLPVPAPDYWERYEGMAVQIDQVLTVTENFNLGSFDEVEVALGRLFNPTQIVAPGASANALQNQNNHRRIIIDDGSTLARAGFDPPARLYPQDDPSTAVDDPGLSAVNTLRAGDRVNESSQGSVPIVGVLDHRFGAYRIHPTGPIFFNHANLRPSAPGAVGGTLRVASFNVLNFFTTLGGRGANTASEFLRQRDKIVRAITGMNAHIVGLIELENNATASQQGLVDALNAATSPGAYAFVNTGVIGSDEIKVGFIYQPDAVTPIGSPAILTNAVDPRTIDTKSRPPLAQSFQRNGPRSDLQRFTVVINHFKSKGSDCNVATPGTAELIDPDTGDGQGNCNLTRVSIAQALIDWLATDPTSSGDPDFLIIGDLNSYAEEDPVRALTDPSFDPPGPFTPNANATYVNLVRRHLGLEAYSYVFEGQSGTLDYGLASASLARQVTGVSEWHINADEPVALDYNEEWIGAILKNGNQLSSLYRADQFRSSDHDPLAVGLNPLCGDLDDDGDVDGNDRNVFRASLGSSTNRRADYDGDGVVSYQDYTIWYACYRRFVQQ